MPLGTSRESVRAGDDIEIEVSREIGQEPDIAVGRSLMFADEYMGSIATLNELDINVYTQSASSNRGLYGL